MNGSINKPLAGYEHASHIREYVIGDMLKNINWRYFVKNEKLTTKKFESISSPPVILNIFSSSDIEKTLSGATFIINEYIKKQIPVGLKTEDLFLKPNIGNTHRHLLLRTLALYDKNQ